jgi:hypothetical protein
MIASNARPDIEFHVAIVCLVLRESFNVERRGVTPVFWHKRARPGTTIKWSNASSSLPMGLTRIGMRWWLNDRVNVGIMIVCKNAPQGQAKYALTLRSTERGDIALQALSWVLRKRRVRSPLSTGYPECPSSSSIGLMLHLHFVATDNWCRATEMGSTAAAVREWAQSGWSETWNDCVVETQAISSSVPLR